MIGIDTKEEIVGNGKDNCDFELGIDGFRYSDLFDAVRLRELADAFYDDVKSHDPVLHQGLTEYIAAAGVNYEPKIESKILTDSAPYLSEFIGRMFKISAERETFQNRILENDPIWKYKFFVQRRAIRNFKKDALTEFSLIEFDEALNELKNFEFGDSLVFDDELAVSSVVSKLLELEDILTKDLEITSSGQDTLTKLHKTFEKFGEKSFGRLFSRFVIEIDETGELLQVKAALKILEIWSAIQFYKGEKKWFSFKTPHALDYQNLVHITRADPKITNSLSGAIDELRRRDGFKLTDDRGTMRDALYEIDYCLICHEREKDSCSTGLHDPKDGSVKRNPLGIPLEGCPLDEKISEMHLMKKQGDSIASLALVTIDNPMCAGTGHRICNDCMKGCIFQKQEPVNIPLGGNCDFDRCFEIALRF